MIHIPGEKYPLALTVLNNARFMRGLSEGLVHIRDTHGDLYGGKWCLPFVMLDSHGNPQMKLMPRYLD